MTTLLQLAAEEFRDVLPRWIEEGWVGYLIPIDSWTTGRAFQAALNIKLCDHDHQLAQQRICMLRLRAERAGKPFDGPKRIRNV